jgi:hypothetical protein
MQRCVAFAAKPTEPTALALYGLRLLCILFLQGRTEFTASSASIQTEAKKPEFGKIDA